MGVFQRHLRAGKAEELIGVSNPFPALGLLGWCFFHRQNPVDQQTDFALA